MLNQILLWVIATYLVIGLLWGLYLLENVFWSHKYADEDNATEYEAALKEDQDMRSMPFYFLIPMSAAILVRASVMWLRDILIQMED